MKTMNEINHKTPLEQLNMRLDFINSIVYRSNISNDAAQRIASQVKEIKKLCKSPTFVNDVYRKQQLEYRIEDVLNHAEELGFSVTNEQAEEIARRFLSKQDCNLPENDQFVCLIQDYAEEHNIVKE